MKLQLGIQILCFILMRSIDGQVNKVIDADEDLLAVESDLSTNEVIQLPNPRPYKTAIKPVPKGFPGERLTFANQKLKVKTNFRDSVTPDGKYKFGYSSDDGTSRKEEGSTDFEEGNRKIGGWEYQGPDGKTYSISFVADQNGFRAKGDHLPQPPPLPPALQRFEDAKNGVKRFGTKQFTGQNQLLTNNRKGKDFEQIKKPISRIGMARDLESSGNPLRPTNFRFNSQKVSGSRRNLFFSPKLHI